MAVQTVQQVQRLPPYLEGLQKRLLQSAFGIFDGKTQTSPGLLDSPLNLPQFQLAGLDPLQQAAFGLAPSLVGSYRPFIEGGGQQTGLGTQAIASGLGMLNPDIGVQAFMNPFQESVIDEINRQAQIGQNRLNAQAIKSGAFGGSREGIQRAEQEGRRLGAVSEAQRKGFTDAVTASQRAAQLSGGLGQALNQLAGTTADLGRVQSELGRADLGMLTNLGGLGREFQQQFLDAQRANLLQQQQDPFTRLQLGQQLISGLPSGDLASTFKSATTPDPNPFLSGVGAYTALQGVQPRSGSLSN